jgi:isopenicillin N synthase-like dioxygenase
LAHHVLRLLARGLPALDQHVLSSFCREPVASVRLLHYPPHPESPDPRLVGAGAHTDFGAITLLLQDAGSGLQVLNQSDATWIDVPPQKGAYVVNVGDMLERWTAGRYKSNVHRVINSSGTDRYSVPFFFDGNLDFVVRPLDAESGGVTVEQHLRKKYEEVYV